MSETTGRFEIYRDAAKEWRWRLKAANGLIVADSAEGYTRRSSAVVAIGEVAHLAYHAPIDEKTRTIRKYQQVQDSEWVQPIRKGYKMRCCDCGLVHVLDFRIHDGKIQFRARRDERATAACRTSPARNRKPLTRASVRKGLAGLLDRKRGSK